MICPNLRIGAPSSTGTTAILWPFGTRCRATTPPDGSAPAEMSSIAMITLSEGSRRRARGVVMIVVFWLQGLVLWGEKFWLPLGEVLEPRGRDPEMLFHSAARGGRIFSLNRTGNCGVLIQARAKLLRRQHSQSAGSFQMD